MSRSRKKSQQPPTDPHAAREAEKYANPIASREVIIGLLEAAEKPLRFDDIAERLHIGDATDLDALRKRLRAMHRDNQVFVGRRGAYGVASRMQLVPSRIIGHRDGYGFAHPLEGGDDFFLSPREMRQVFDGDEVLISQIGTDPRGRPEGSVVEVTKRAHDALIGRYMEESGIGYLLPHNNRITQHVLIPPNKKGSAQPGQIVAATITDYPTNVLGAKGEITEILGDHLDPGLEIDVAIRAHGIPWEWPDAVLREAGQLRDEPTEADKANRVDLCHKAFVTIDGEDARDFDDAVYCEAEGRGYRLWVAIADVSHYVRIGSALDEEALNRGNSVYFPERVVPMFPEVLSNGLCSLKPRVDRLAMVCEMFIGGDGSLIEWHFYEGVIHSHARLTYTEVGEILETGQSDTVDRRHFDDLYRLHALYKILRHARDQRGAIDFETVETRIIFTEDRKIESIVPVVRNDAHKVIEECMLIANVATALTLAESQLPVLFRVHEGPSAERLENLRSFLGELALDLPGGLTPTPTDYQTLLSQLHEREDASVIQTMMLRSLRQAVYQPENKGHFGLHYEAYTHFTSPIRRYPDLLVHRAIRHLIRSRKKPQHVRRVSGAGVIPKANIYPYDELQMATLGEHASMTERRADDATREVDAWLKCEYLKDKVGEVYPGVIAAVTNFGVFVELHDLYIEGLCHISALPGDYYHFDQAKQRLVGERTRRTFALGASVTVQVARVDLDERKIDLEMVDAGGATSRRSGGDGSAGNASAGDKAPGGRGKGKGRGPRGASGSGGSAGDAHQQKKKKPGAKGKRGDSGQKPSAAGKKQPSGAGKKPSAAGKKPSAAGKNKSGTGRSKRR